MTSQYIVKVDSKDVSAALARLIAALPESGDATAAMKAVARALKTGTLLRFKTQRDPSGTLWLETHRGGQILRQSSRLRDSISTHATEDTAAVGTNVIYGPAHQFGGVIRAKNARFLAIPIGAAAKKNAANGGGPRHHPALLGYVQSLKGPPMLSDAATGTPEYLLKRSVKLPARPYLGLSEGDKDEVVGVVDDYLAGKWAV